MKRSEVIAAIKDTIGNIEGAVDLEKDDRFLIQKIREGLLELVARRALETCEKAGMMPPCSKKGLIRYAVPGEKALIAQAYPAKYDWEPENET